MSFLLSVFYYVSNCAIYGNLVILPVLGVRYFVKCPSGYLRNIIYLLAGLRLCFPFLFYCPFAAFEGREVVTTYSVDFHYTTGVSLISIPHNASIVLSIIWIMGLAAIMAYRVIRFASQKSQCMQFIG